MMRKDDRPWWRLILKKAPPHYVRATDEREAAMEAARLGLVPHLQGIEPAVLCWKETYAVDGDPTSGLVHTRPSRYAAVRGPYDAGVDIFFETELSGDPTNQAFGGVANWPKLVICIRLPYGTSEDAKKRFVQTWQIAVDAWLHAEGLDT